MRDYITKGVRFVSIVFLCIIASIVYGVIHDQFTIRLSLEYFTVLHPRLFPEDFPVSPTLLALCWGIIATWWVGLILGVIIAATSCLGNRPSLSVKALVLPILKLLLTMGILAAVAAPIGYGLGWCGILLPAPLVLEEVPPEHINALFAAGASHLTSYASGFIGGIWVAVWAWNRRIRYD